MPYPNEHAARINSPDKYERIRRENDKLGDGIDVIWGVLPNGKVEVQAIRFDSSKFTPAEAKAWLKEHSYEPIEFEEASKAESKLAENNLGEPLLVLKNKLILKEGTWNGYFYPADEIKKCLEALNSIPEDPTYKNQNSLFTGSTTDHTDSTGTWIGNAYGFSWDEAEKGIRAERLEIVDKEVANKLAYQQKTGESKWGISPVMESNIDGKTVRDIRFLSIGLVLNPAQGSALMLSKKDDKKIIAPFTALNLKPTEKGNMDMEKSEVEKMLSEALASAKAETEKQIGELKKSTLEVAEAVKALSTSVQKLAEASKPPQKTEAELKAETEKLASEKKAAEEELKKLDSLKTQLSKAAEMKKSGVTSENAKGEKKMDPQAVIRKFAENLHQK